MPVNKCVRVPNLRVGIDPLIEVALAIYSVEYAHWVDEWISKWPEKKRVMILLSQEFDQIKPDKVKAFVKKEVTKGKMPTKARAIQAYVNDATAAFVAPKFYSMQKAIAEASLQSYRVRGVDTTTTFASGMSHDDISRWMETKLSCTSSNRWIVEVDGKNWDATMQNPLLNWCQDMVYKKFDPEVAKFAKQGNDVRGSFLDRKNGVTVNYKAVGTRKSGHNDTSTGNTIINMSITLEAALSLDHVTAVHGIFSGDDSLYIIDFDKEVGNPYPRIAKSLQSFGIQPEGEAFRDPLDVSFISGEFYPTAMGYAFGPKCGKLLAGLFCTVKDVPLKKLAAYNSSIARSFLPLYSRAPLVGEWLRMHIVTDAHYTHEKYVKDLSVDRGILWELAFLHKYGLVRCNFGDLIRYLHGLRKSTGIIVNEPVVTHMIERDMADPIDRINRSFSWAK